MVSAIGGGDQPASPPRDALALLDLEVTRLAHAPPRPTTSRASVEALAASDGLVGTGYEARRGIDDHDVAARPPGSTRRTIAQLAAPLDQDPVRPSPVTRLLRSRRGFRSVRAARAPAGVIRARHCVRVWVPWRCCRQRAPDLAASNWSVVDHQVTRPCGGPGRAGDSAPAAAVPRGFVPPADAVSRSGGRAASVSSAWRADGSGRR